MKYQGSCHCGNVRFEAELTLDKVMACNCSLCRRKGHLLAFTPEEGFRLLSGTDALKDYQFGQKTIHHFFCGHCGIGTFGKSTHQGKEMRAINARCLEDVDPDQLKVEHFDGRSL